MEVKDKIERHIDHPPDCFASRLWESSADLNLDLVSIAYGNCRNSRPPKKQCTDLSQLLDLLLKLVQTLLLGQCYGL